SSSRSPDVLEPGSAAAFAIVLGLFGVGAGVIGIFGGAAARYGGSAELWRHYGATLLIVAAVLVPAALHPALLAGLAALAAWRPRIWAFSGSASSAARLRRRIRWLFSSAGSSAAGRSHRASVRKRHSRARWRAAWPAARSAR